MKRVLILLITLLMLPFLGCVLDCPLINIQEKMPKSIIKEFHNTHPHAENISWEKDGEYWEVEFTSNGQEMEIVYDRNGSVVETEVQISQDALPGNLLLYLEDMYTSYTIIESEKIENTMGIFYEIELSADGKNMEMIFYEDGRFYRMEDEDEDDDEESQ